MWVIIDECDRERVESKRWNYSSGRPGKDLAGSVVWAGKGLPLVRIILELTDPEMLVSHVNGNRLDCRRANLVLRNRSELAKARKTSEERVKRFTPYPDPERPGVWRVPLRGYLQYREALVDDADMDIVRGKHWNWSTYLGARAVGAVVEATAGSRCHLARLILGVRDGGDRVRHANEDSLDCRRENLVLMTLAEMSRSSRKMGLKKGRPCSSGFKGVSRDEVRERWVVQIKKGRVHVHVDRYEDEISAAKAYDAASRVMFGEWGYLNFPDEPSNEETLINMRKEIDVVVQETRASRIRQRRLETVLRQHKPGNVEGVGEEEGVIVYATARMMFDVTTGVWKRWEKYGWVPKAGEVEGEQVYRLREIRGLLDACGLKVLPYPDPQRPGCYRVPLSGEVTGGREAIIDADAVPLVQPRRWRFAAREEGRGGEVQTMIPTENLRLHHVVMGTSGEETMLGFRNDDPLDCRRENLVMRDLTDIRANARKQSTFCGRPCTSRFKGVCRPQRGNRWTAQIKRNHVQYKLGTFRDELAAAQAYDEAARELFGEHARLNFPDGVDARLEQETRNDMDQRQAA